MKKIIPGNNIVMHSRRAFKIILIGQCSVGKSSIIYRLCQNKFGGVIDSTIGCAFNRKYIKINEKEVALNCWDTAGQERFKSIVPMYFKDAHGIVVAFDVTNRESFEELRGYWLPLIVDYYKDQELPKIIVAANKMDLVHDRDMIETNKRIDRNIAELEERHNIELICYKTSAASGVNIDNMFEKLASELIDEIGYEVEEDDFFFERRVTPQAESYYSCCWGGTPIIDDDALTIN